MVRRRSLAMPLLALWAVGCTSAVEHPGRSTWAQVYEHSDQQERTPEPSMGVKDQAAATAEIVTLPQALAYAEQHNPGLRAAFDRWTAAAEEAPQATSLPDPRFSYAYFVEPVETRVGPQRQKFGFTQEIPLFGKLGSQGDVAIHGTNMAAAQFERERLALRFRVTQLWNDYYYLERAIRVTEESVRLMTYLENVALTQYAAGRSSHATAIRAQVELGRLEDRLRALRDQRRSLVVGLNAELARPVSASLSPPDSLPEVRLQQTQQNLQQWVSQSNPQLLALRASAARDSAAADVAGKSAIPNLTLGAEYIDIGPAVDPLTPDSGKNAAVAMASINVPLWFSQHRAESAQANARRAASVHEAQQLQNLLFAELERALFEYRDAERRIELYAYTLLPKARQSFEVTEDAFTSGEASFTDLIDAQRTLLEFELAYERARADRTTRLAQLETIVGQELLGDDSASEMEGSAR